MKLIVAITAASGAIYARLVVERLLAARKPDAFGGSARAAVSEIALIHSARAREVMDFEGVALPEDPRIRVFDNNDLFAAPASGSARYEAMVIVPATVGTMGRVASGVSQTLLERAGDVMLKERRRLVLVVRETPLSLIHLRNMITLTEAGAVILPACPSFYSDPADIEALCATVAERAVELLGIDVPHYQWGK